MKRLICTLALINIMIVSSFCQDTLKAVLVKDIKISSSPNSSENSSWPRNFSVLQDRILFVAYAGSNSNFYDLWTTDGTGEGTRMIKSQDGISPANVITGLTVWGNRIIFTANDGIHGYEPWISDGTPGSARMIKDIKPNNPNYPSVDGSEPREFKVFKDKVYFQADTWGGKQLFVTDGTDAGTQMLTKTGTGSWEPSGFIEFNDKLFFTCQHNYLSPQLWVTDGTVNGTHEFKSFANGSVGNLSINRTAIVYKNKLYFTTTIDTLGYEMWVTDGTSSGTRLFKDINTIRERGSWPHGFTLFKDKLYFIADDGIHGHELWCSNEDSTFLVKDIGMSGGALEYAEQFVANNQMFFAAQSISGGIAELWTSDGTAEGTQKLPANDGITVEAPKQFVVWKGKIVFVAGQYNPQLWITDGTAQGTRPVFREEVIPWAALRSNSELAIFKGDLYFNATYDQSTGCELYKLTVDTSLIPLDILQDPLSINICTGDSAFFEVKVTGSPELKFQWMKNYGPIENATRATYKIAHASKEDAGDYMCVVKNSEGEMVSKSAYLGVYDLSADFEVIDSTKIGYYLIKFTGNAPETAVCHWGFDEGEVLAGSGKGPYRVAWKNSGTKNIILELTLNNCSSVVDKTVEVISTNTTLERESPVLSMYPNPVRDELTIDFTDKQGSKKVELFDAHGHRLLDRQTNDRSLRLDLSAIRPGMYYIRVQNDASYTLQKVVKN